MKLNYKSYPLPATVRGLSRDEMRSRINDFVFREIESPEIPFTVGWVNPFNSADTDSPVIFHGSCMHVSARIDEFSFTAKQLKPIIDRLKIEQNMNNMSLSKRAKQQLKEQAEKHLRMHATPKTSIVVMSIDFESEKAILFSKNNRELMHVQSLFEKTFPLSPLEEEKAKELDVQKFFKKILDNEIDGIQAGKKITINCQGAKTTIDQPEISTSPVVHALVEKEGAVISSIELIMGDRNPFVFTVKENLKPTGVKIPVSPVKEELPEDFLNWNCEMVQKMEKEFMKIMEK